MSPDKLASLLTRLGIYVFVAIAGAELLHAREPANPLGAAFVILLAGIAALGAARTFARRPRSTPLREMGKGRSPPS